jgi:hypothetical protein
VSRPESAETGVRTGEFISQVHEAIRRWHRNPSP